MAVIALCSITAVAAFFFCSLPAAVCIAVGCVLFFAAAAGALLRQILRPPDPQEAVLRKTLPSFVHAVSGLYHGFATAASLCAGGAILALLLGGPVAWPVVIGLLVAAAGLALAEAVCYAVAEFFHQGALRRLDPPTPPGRGGLDLKSQVAAAACGILLGVGLFLLCPSVYVVIFLPIPCRSVCGSVALGIAFIAARRKG
jgi:hypothetical protein